MHRLALVDTGQPGVDPNPALGRVRKLLAQHAGPPRLVGEGERPVFDVRAELARQVFGSPGTSKAKLAAELQAMHEQAYPNGRIDVAQERPLDVIAKLDASFRLDLLSRTRLLGLLEEVASAETPRANRNAALRACSRIITRLRPKDGVAPPCVVVAPPACPEERETKQALEISVDVHDKRRWQIVSRGNWRMCDFERAFADAKPKGTLADSPLWGRREIFAAPSRFWERISPGQDLAVSSRRTPSSSDLTALLQRVAEHCPGVVAVAAHLPGMSVVSGHERTPALPTLRAAVETHLDAHELVSMIADSGLRLDVELVGIAYHALHRFDPAQWPNAPVG